MAKKKKLSKRGQAWKLLLLAFSNIKEAMDIACELPPEDFRWFVEKSKEYDKKREDADFQKLSDKFENRLATVRTEDDDDLPF